MVRSLPSPGLQSGKGAGSYGENDKRKKPGTVLF